MRLKLSQKFQSCSIQQLNVVDKELTPQDCEYYERIGWKNYHKDDWKIIKLPELGNPIYFKKSSDIVVDIKGKRYKVNLEEDCNEQPYECERKYLTLEPTDEPLTVPINKVSDHRFGYSCRFFGQPTFVQNSIYPKDTLGNPCYHLVTFENGWGDSGNYNILIGFDEHDEPNIAFFEASCC